MAVLIIGMAGVAAVSLQTRCVDAAREAARLAARGDTPAEAIRSAQRVAPGGATVQVRRRGDVVVATVAVESVVLPWLSLGAEALAAVEPHAG